MFGFTPKSFLGVDFGTSSIKVVELGIEKNEPILLNYGEIMLATLETLRSGDQGSYDAQITNFLRALLEKVAPKSRQVYVAMPAFIGLIALVDFPRMNETELKEAIQFEAHKYIPSPLEEIALSWEVVGERAEAPSEMHPKGGTKLEVLLVAALNKEVERYESYIQSVGYDMQLLELETFSMVRSTVRQSTDSVLLIDIGSRATNFVLVENRLVKMSRNLDVGGKDVTRTLAESLGVTLERAEVLKKSGKDFLNQPESRITFLSLDLIVTEAKRILETRQAKNPQAAKIRGIILSGGTASMVGLAQYFTTQFGLPVEVADPWRGIRYDQKLRTAIERMGTSYSVAIGLALHGIERNKQQAEKFSWHALMERIKNKLNVKIV